MADRIKLSSYVPSDRREQPEDKHHARILDRETKLPEVPPIPETVEGVELTVPTVRFKENRGKDSFDVELGGREVPSFPPVAPEVPQFVESQPQMPGAVGVETSARVPPTVVPDIDIPRTMPMQAPQFEQAEGDLFIEPDRLTRRSDIARHSVYWTE